jgi:hypothetical protein
MKRQLSGGYNLFGAHDTEVLPRNESFMVKQMGRNGIGACSIQTSHLPFLISDSEGKAVAM